MAGTISSLGIGSGVLTADIIEQLKDNDYSLSVTPIENKITLEEQKGQALDLLDSLLTTFRTSVRALDDDALYQQRSVTGNSDGVSVTVEAGVNPQSFSISDAQMALANVHESGSFSSATESIASGDGSMWIDVGSDSFEINYTATMTLTELKDAINQQAGDKVSASVLQVGDSDYRLVLTSNETGVDQAITLSDSIVGSLNASLYKQNDSIETGAFAADTDLVASNAGTMTVTMGGTDYTISYDATTTLSDLASAINTAVGSNVASVHQTATGEYRLNVESTATGADDTLALTDNSGFLDAAITSYTENGISEEIQAGRDATFKYNGISVTRSSNEIDDLITGITINLLQDDGSANINIAQYSQGIADELNTMVQNYNTLMTELDDMTLADTESGNVGVFNGDNSIRMIGREITKIITSINDEGYSLAQFGISLNQSGYMTFSQSDFNDKMDEDPSALERFFSGATDIDTNGNSTEVQGVFTRLTDLMDNYVGYSGIMTTLITASDNKMSSLEDERTRTVTLLDARYDAMTARFIEYDAIISSLESQFSSLQQQIEMAINSNN